MKKMLAVLVAGLIVSPALASTLNLNVKSSNGVGLPCSGNPQCATGLCDAGFCAASNSVTVIPGGTVNFKIEGILSDNQGGGGNLNEGLALVGFDLHFTGGALAANTIVTPTGTISCANPMRAFVKPEGITNPAGYGGTLIGGDLVQVGGGLNSIKNSVDNPACAPNCARFPIGTPLLGVAQPAVCGNAVIATGSFTAPASGGPYTLQVLNGFANVIKDGEVLANAFLATEAAPVNVVANLQLTITTDTCTGSDAIVSSSPSNCSVDARRPNAPGNLTALQGYNSIALTFKAGCNVAGIAPSAFTVACNPAGAPCPTINLANTVDQTVTLTFSSVIPAGKWTCVTHTASGDQACIGSLPGDVSGNLFTAPADIIDLIDNLNGIRVPPLTVDHCDMDRSNLCLPADIITLIDMLNGSGFAVWSGKSLAACPSP